MIYLFRLFINTTDEDAMCAISDQSKCECAMDTSIRLQSKTKGVSGASILHNLFRALAVRRLQAHQIVLNHHVFKTFLDQRFLQNTSPTGKHIIVKQSRAKLISLVIPINIAIYDLASSFTTKFSLYIPINVWVILSVKLNPTGGQRK